MAYKCAVVDDYVFRRSLCRGNDMPRHISMVENQQARHCHRRRFGYGYMACRVRTDRHRPHAVVTGMVIIAGIVGTARVILGAHDTLQVLAGWVLGAVVTYIMLGIPAPDVVVTYPI